MKRETSRRKSAKLALATLLVAGAALCAVGEDEKCPVSANVRGHENIEWSTSYAYGLTDATRDLPRVLLIGDSICNGYQQGVRERLKGKMNVTYWISSYCATRELARKIVRCGADRFYISLDYFDASINRVAAWVNGFRNFQKALLFAFLQPVKTLRKLQDSQDFTTLQVLQEELKLYPFGEVWAEYCKKCGVAADESWLAEVRKYEKDVLAKRS